MPVIYKSYNEKLNQLTTTPHNSSVETAANNMKANCSKINIIYPIALGNEVS